MARLGERSGNRGLGATRFSLMYLKFEWDARKYEANLRKHRIDFEEARTVFSDPLAAFFDDPDHSVDEGRELVVEHSNRGRLLFVSFTERDGKVRIISARSATRVERQGHEKFI